MTHWPGCQWIDRYFPISIHFISVISDSLMESFLLLAFDSFTQLLLSSIYSG
jgi:hypothetical protein